MFILFRLPGSLHSYCKVGLKRTLYTRPKVYLLKTHSTFYNQNTFKEQFIRVIAISIVLFIRRQTIFIYYFICIRSSVFKGRGEPMDTLCSI